MNGMFSIKHTVTPIEELDVPEKLPKTIRFEDLEIFSKEAALIGWEIGKVAGQLRIKTPENVFVYKRKRKKWALAGGLFKPLDFPKSSIFYI